MADTQAAEVVELTVDELARRAHLPVRTIRDEAQLRSRWGRDGARVVMDTSGTKIWLSGISDPDTLAAASTTALSWTSFPGRS